MVDEIHDLDDDGTDMLCYSTTGWTNRKSEINAKKEVKMSNSGKLFRVRVTDLRTGKSKANVTIPFGLVESGMKIGAKFAPAAVEGLDMNQLIAAIKSGGEGKVVDVEDEEKGEHVEVFIE